MARPSPEEAPVMMATLSRRRGLELGVMMERFDEGNRGKREQNKNEQE